MKIRQLRLINVKSYVDETLDFQLGINFISGINGAGKSTIIESLGYALFNHNPYLLKQFLREGTSQGEIQVLIEANDERLYRVVRKFTATASTKWEIWDEETSSMLQDLHGAEDVQRWLKEIMNLGYSDDLSDLFKQIIAVQQGQFTAPFLEPAGARTQTFDAVLKVEDFRTAFSQTAFLERTFQQEMENLKRQREILASTFEESLPLLKQDLVKIGEEQAFKAERLQKLERKLQENLKTLDLEEQKQIQVEELERAQALLAVKIETQQNQIKITGEDLADAQNAQKILEENRAAFELYESLQKDLIQVEKRLAEKEEVEQKITEIKLQLSSAETKLKADQKRFIEDQADVEKSIKSLREEVQAGEENLQHLTRVKEDLATWFPLGTRWQSSFNKVNSWLQANRPYFDDGRMERQRLEDLEQTMAQIATSLESLPQLEASIAKLGPEDTLENIERQILERQNELDALLRNEEYLTKGLCPIILEACPSQRVSHGLDEFFKEQKMALEKELSVLAKEEAKAKEVQVKRAELEERLRAGQQQAFTLERHEANYKGIIQSSIQTLARLPWTELTQILGELGDLQREYNERRETLPLAIEKWQLAGQGNLPPAPSVISAPPSLPEKMGLKVFSLWLNALASWEGEFNLSYENWRNYGLTWTQRLQELETEIVTKLAMAQGERTRQGAQLGELVAKQEGLKREKLRLETTAQALTQENQTLLKLQDEVKSLGEPKIEQSNLKGNLEKHKASYQLYQANLLGAKKAEALQTRYDLMETQLGKYVQQFEADKESLKKLLAIYSREQHQALIFQVEEEKKTLLELKRDLKELASDEDKLKKQVEELEIRQRKWQELGVELQATEEAKEFSKLFRQVLREAADPIAQQYRDSLSILATQIYRKVSNDNVRLEWGSQYELQLVDFAGERERIRVFRQLSGGEQMTAALAIRLALMQLFSPLKIGFFDEPTTNLDQERRESLALAIQTATVDFEQLFLISHDDSFDAVTDTVISLHKEGDQGSQVK